MPRYGLHLGVQFLFWLSRRKMSVPPTCSYESQNKPENWRTIPKVMEKVTHKTRSLRPPNLKKCAEQMWTIIHRLIELDVPGLPLEFGQLLRIKFRATHCSRAVGQKETCASVLSKETYRAFPCAFFGCRVHMGVPEHREHRSGAFWGHFANRKMEIANQE